MFVGGGAAYCVSVLSSDHTVDLEPDGLSCSSPSSALKIPSSSGSSGGLTTVDPTFRLSRAGRDDGDARPHRRELEDEVTVPSWPPGVSSPSRGSEVRRGIWTRRGEGVWRLPSGTGLRGVPCEGLG